jgi:hypothetical protein
LKLLNRLYDITCSVQIRLCPKMKKVVLQYHEELNYTWQHMVTRNSYMFFSVSIHYIHIVLYAILGIGVPRRSLGNYFIPLCLIIDRISDSCDNKLILYIIISRTSLFWPPKEFPYWVRVWIIFWGILFIMFFDY